MRLPNTTTHLVSEDAMLRSACTHDAVASLPKARTPNRCKNRQFRHTCKRLRMLVSEGRALARLEVATMNNALDHCARCLVARDHTCVRVLTPSAGKLRSPRAAAMD